MKTKKWSHRYDINRRRSRHEHKYSKCKKCLITILLICVKQYLSNIWSPIYEKFKQHWGWVGKKCVAYKNPCCVIKCGTYPYAPGRDRMNNSHVSYFVSTCLIL